MLRRAGRRDVDRGAPIAKEVELEEACEGRLPRRNRGSGPKANTVIAALAVLIALAGPLTMAAYVVHEVVGRNPPTHAALRAVTANHDGLHGAAPGLGAAGRGGHG